MTKRQKEEGWDELSTLWLHNRPESTRQNYSPVIRNLELWVKGRPVSQVKLPDLQRFADSFSQQKPRTQIRKINTVKSFIAFLHRTGYLPFDFGRALRAPKVPSELAARFLEPEQIMRMIELEPNKRNKVILRVLYATAARASEASGLRWCDIQRRGRAGQLTIVRGKGSRSRTILLSAETFKALQSIRPPDVDLHMPVFVSREGANQALSRQGISDVVTHAAHRAGLNVHATAHFLRHSHATSALEKGVSIAVIKETMGHRSIETTAKYLHIKPNQSSATALGV